MPHYLMVVDDDRSILDMIRMILEGDGYRVRTFHSSPEALREALKNPPDGIITDLMMPEMNGLELLNALRASPATADVPAIICSAYYENLLATRPEMERLGITSIHKPFHVDDLLDAVEATAGTRARVRRTARRSGMGPGRVSRFAAFHA